MKLTIAFLFLAIIGFTSAQDFISEFGSRIQKTAKDLGQQADDFLGLADSSIDKAVEDGKDLRTSIEKQAHDTRKQIRESIHGFLNRH